MNNIRPNTYSALKLIIIDNRGLSAFLPLIAGTTCWTASTTGEWQTPPMTEKLSIILRNVSSCRFRKNIFETAAHLLKVIP